ncbi:MAG: Rrf2 family transcriptional regulator [Chloroflexota bacterium]|jgi:Rrf2 family transcriptional regulator, nitric oxide-sensitive transcriptional repressor|uniref:Rrf2 family transcriptional regulator n=1 Tax=Candidatus Nitricoxidivorans perseverans TaxID=2975601 RepID=A0AA49FMC4_9PROT|nr:MAG: Rrf2 family transcriptional regulator [Candidatus Nitricoxidivorans perseverans]
MRLTTFTDYTLRVLMYLALQPERRVTIPEIASAYGISENHLTKVVHHLGRSGMIETLRGKSGGLRLAQTLEAIRLGTVVRASEGEAAFVACMGGTSEACCIAPVCRLADILEEALGALYASLDRYTLADLVASPRKLQRLLLMDG